MRSTTKSLFSLDHEELGLRRHLGFDGLVSLSGLIYKGPDATRHGHEFVSGDIR